MTSDIKQPYGLSANNILMAKVPLFSPVVASGVSQSKGVSPGTTHEPQIVNDSVSEAVLKFSLHSAMPFVGGLIKQPAVVGENFMGRNPHLTLSESVKQVYSQQGARGLWRGYFLHLSKVLPSSYIASNTNFAFEQKGITDWRQKFAAAFMESVFGNYQEVRELQKNATFDQPKAPSLAASQGYSWQRVKHAINTEMSNFPQNKRLYAATLRSAILRNYGYWEGVALSRKAEEIAKERYQSPLAAKMSKASVSIAFGALTSPLHVAFCEAFKTGDPNTFRHMWDVNREFGLSGLFRPALPRAAKVGLSIFIVAEGQDLLNRWFTPKASGQSRSVG